MPVYNVVEGRESKGSVTRPLRAAAWSQGHASFLTTNKGRRDFLPAINGRVSIPSKSMNRKKYSLWFLGIVSVCFIFFVTWGNHCKNLQQEYGSDPFVTLSGTLRLKLFPGPPEYSSVETGDRADFCWILDLDKESFILAVNTPVQELGLDFKDIIKRPNANEVFLFPDCNVDESFRKKNGQHISVSGYLFHAHTTHHYSPMLLTVPEHSYTSQDGDKNLTR